MKYTETEKIFERKYLEPKQGDMVNHPSHYTQGGIECLEAIKASMTVQEVRGSLKGNIMKYLWRYENKGNPLQDLQKAKFYLERLEKENT